MRAAAHGPNSRAGIVTEIVMIVIALMFLYPIFYMFMASFKRPEDFYNPLKLPTSLYLGHFAKTFERVDVLQGFLNTLVVSVGSIVLIVVVASMAGYTISRLPHKGFQVVFYFLLSGMIIPMQTSMYPIFRLGVALHLIDTRTFLVLLYTAGTIPIATFLYAGFTKSIPRELEESASLDGCGRFRTFWLIIFPLLLPATGTVVVTNVFGFWNDLFGPLLYLKSADKMTLMPQIVQFKANNQSIDYGPIFAMCSLATLPLLALFFVTQKYMLRGLVVGSVKG
ncbi:carbohydrate ABC transporter permease [Paenibacillus sp.]|uniref:carbohydrate ABC transporter permease n=1 Tax=Paenibacillus sp. TaxID=58172 RepID=UPI002D70E4CD|nr:carbohydrate ABC transporter permease [Paenibacillus sp.]HZG56185.1 carbohydrate ABC transporter permease [Paenibacillus sp.]